MIINQVIASVQNEGLIVSVIEKYEHISASFWLGCIPIGVAGISRMAFRETASPGAITEVPSQLTRITIALRLRRKFC